MRAWIGLLSIVICCGGCDTESRRPPPASTAAAVQVAPAPASPLLPVGWATLRGTAHAEGAPVAGAFVILSERDSGLLPADVDPAQLFTGPDGAFAVDLPQGEYDLMIVGPGRRVAEARVQPGGQPLDLELRRDDDAVVRFVEGR